MLSSFPVPQFEMMQKKRNWLKLKFEFNEAELRLFEIQRNLKGFFFFWWEKGKF